MFYESVRAAWEVGRVRVILPVVGFGENATVEAEGLVGIKAAFLSRGERQKLVELSKLAAQEHKAREDAISKKAEMWLSHRIFKVMHELTLQFPCPIALEQMSKVEIIAARELGIVQETRVADEAERRARAFREMGDEQIAEALFEWVEDIRGKVEVQKQHFETPEYLAWLNESDD
jgi:hypothetical protein